MNATDRNRLVRLARERLDVALETEDDDAADVARKTLADLGVDEAGDDLPAETDLDRALRDDGRPYILPAKPESRSATVRAAFFLDVLDDLARVLALDDLTPEERIAYTEAQTNARASLAALGLRVALVKEDRS